MSKTNKDKGYRSFTKATTWRVIATCDTIFLAWLITGSIENGLKIGLTEVVTKIFLFYMHERIWGKMHFLKKRMVDDKGRVFYNDKHSRSLIKGISWRFFGTMDTILISLFWTGSVGSAFKIGGAEIITKVSLFWLHERVWMKIPWGRETHLEIITPVAEEEPLAAFVEER
ncbi:MAG: DUF2061 domain-containing protein [Chitinophagales bacterium]